MVERYPLLLDLAGRRCLVVGGGAVASRKVEGLARAGAAITVVAPQAAASIAEAGAAGLLNWQRRVFRPGDLDGQVLAFAATSSSAVNRTVDIEGRARGVWVNLADDPEGCGFQVPATLREGRVTVAVSTEGASPALAAWTRDRVAAGLPAGLGELAELAGALRRQLQAEPGSYRALFDSGVAEDLRRRDWTAVERKVTKYFGEGDAVRAALHDLRSEER